MPAPDPVPAFEALAHEARLAILRRLVPVGRDGLAAGEIGAQLGLPANALSFHLTRLRAAGLLTMRRAGRYQYYAVDYAALGGLVDFLARDCCAEAPAGCLPGCPGGADTAASRDREMADAAS